ncbi:hypothetical protein C0995_000551, partial [Termitomyces sp. Mi166
MEDDDNDEEATQKLRKELEDFVVPTTFDDKLLASLLPPPSEYYEGDIGLPRGAKISGGQKGDITLVSPATRALMLEKNGTMRSCLWNGIGVRTQKKCPPLAALVMAKHGYKGKGKAKALLEDSEQTDTKQSFKLRELVNSDSDKEDEEDRVCVIKKIIELDKEVEIVVPKAPVVGPLCPTSKPIVLVPSAPKPVPKLIIVLASPIAGPSTVPIASSSAP